MSKTILVVDDDPVFRRSMRQLLAPEGYEVLEAESSVAALIRLGLDSVDMLLTDVFTSEMGSIELCRGAKELEPTLEIIGISPCGSLGASRVIERVAETFPDFLQRPIDRRDLLGEIRKLENSVEPRALLAKETPIPGA